MAWSPLGRRQEARARVAVRWWAVPRWRALVLTACLWLPVLVFVGFSVPGDSCTDEQRRELSADSCDRITDS